MNFNRKINNAFQSNKVPIVGFSLNATLFPELLTNETTISDKVILNYKNISFKLVPEDFKPIVHIKEKTKEEYELEEKIKYQNNTIKIIDEMNKRWLKYRLYYIELYGEDEYEKWYIPLQDWEEKEVSDSEDESDSEIENSDEENY